MSEQQPNNPLHGVTLQAILEELVERHGWFELSCRIRIRCFAHEPSIKSSLKFLRKTPWARGKLEELYLAELQIRAKKQARNRARAARRAYSATQEELENR